jgi:enolase-phosphatase E1
MIVLNPSTKVLLFDIEGTTSSISFVHDVLFPFARARALEFLTKNWRNPDVLEIGKRIMGDALGLGFSISEESVPPTPVLAFEAVCYLMDRDAKVTGLKQLQGLIWKVGFESGEIRSHVYPDFPGAVRRFREMGQRLFIYSSGSIQAQKLYFSHTSEGNLLPNFEGHFDTTIGAKVESASYLAIAASIGIPPTQICFFSDAVKEIDAARNAGMETVWVVRPGNALSKKPDGHAIGGFGEIL